MRTICGLASGALAMFFATTALATDPSVQKAEGTGSASPPASGAPAAAGLQGQTAAAPVSVDKAGQGVESGAVKAPGLQPGTVPGATGASNANVDKATADGAAKVASLVPDLPVRANRPPPPPVTLKATIDLSRQQMTVTERGKLLYTWKISSGRAGYYTPAGDFKPQWRSRMWYSRQYDDAPMPYAVFFNGGIATHGTTATYRLGRPASHGCVRLTTANAKRFYTLVARHGNASTRIVVTGRTPGSSNRFAKAGKSGRSSSSSQRRRRAGNGYERREQRGVRYVQTPYGYKVYYTGPSRANGYSRYSGW